MNWLQTPCIAFEGSKRIAQGALKEVAPICKTVMDRSAGEPRPLPLLIFDQASSETIEVDWRGTHVEFVARLEQRAAQMPVVNEQPDPLLQDEVDLLPRGPGRPKLGVVAREVTLLPRHWAWLANQTGGASVALRKLVEVARLASHVKDRARKCRDVGYKFMSTMAGHEVGFEEASRALFAGDQNGFELRISAWPEDVRDHLKVLLAEAFSKSP
jgi:uncharacterized protein